MPLVILAGVFLFLLALAVAMPLSLVQRYRAGTARRRAHAWVATINLAGLAFSTPLFLLGAAITIRPLDRRPTVNPSLAARL